MSIQVHRRGEIVGKLVWLIAILLTFVWIIGHWVGADASATQPTVSSETFPQDSPKPTDSTVNAQDPNGPGRIGAGPNESEQPDSMRVDSDASAAGDGAIGPLQQRLDAMAATLKKQTQQVAGSQQSSQAWKTSVVRQQAELQTQIEAVRGEVSRLAASVKNFEQATATRSMNAVRTWTMQTGKQANASFAGLEGDTVVLAARGRTFRIPMNLLIEADQAFAREMARQ